MKRRQVLRRAAALLTALCLVFCLVFSSTFLGINAEHECLSSEDCPICTEMSLCNDLMRAFGTAAPSEEEERPAAPVFSVEEKKSTAPRRRFAATPVSLKVKISC